MARFGSAGFSFDGAQSSEACSAGFDVPLSRENPMRIIPTRLQRGRTGANEKIHGLRPAFGATGESSPWFPPAGASPPAFARIRPVSLWRRPGLKAEWRQHPVRIDHHQITGMNVLAFVKYTLAQLDPREG